MLETFAKIVGSILRSLFISIVMFVIAFSVITGEFPPNFGRIAEMYSSFKTLNDVNQSVGHSHSQVSKEGAVVEGNVGSGDDDMVEGLNQINRKRAEVGASMLGGSSPKLQGQVVPVPVSSEVQVLRDKVKELEVQLFRLQDRVNRLESSSAE